MGDIARVKIAGYRVGGRHQEKDETESAAAGQRYDEVSQNLHQGLESAMAPLHAFVEVSKNAARQKHASVMCCWQMAR